ncbi:MAG TPA: ABC transporter permease subunit [Geminicoccaceae bacterium]
MHATLAIVRRELQAYYGSPLAYVFIVIFLALAGALTFHVASWLERGRADLQPFFQWHPWLYLFLVPAVGMRLWAEERKTGTIEFLMTLPVATWQAVVGKFVAAWLFIGSALALTFPIWITVNYLGTPDNGVIVAAYLGSWLIAGGMLAVSAAVSALTRNQVIAFVLAAAICFVFMMSGLEIVQSPFRGWAPAALADAIAGISLLSAFQQISQGVIDLRHAILFTSLIGLSLFVNTAIVELKKGS